MKAQVWYDPEFHSIRYEDEAIATSYPVEEPGFSSWLLDRLQNLSARVEADRKRFRQRYKPEPVPLAELDQLLASIKL